MYIVLVEYESLLDNYYFSNYEKALNYITKKEKSYNNFDVKIENNKIIGAYDNYFIVELKEML